MVLSFLLKEIPRYGEYGLRPRFALGDDCFRDGRTKFKVRPPADADAH